MVYQSRSKMYKSIKAKKHTTTETSTRIHVLMRRMGDRGYDDTPNQWRGDSRVEGRGRGKC